ncbi:MAG TPA: glycoside hydrolase family 2 TIM barrel-domain containing protein [Solirubrobacteraceae bacterium]|nr:glycoside hydrolase family 2 TIM barrel-domain containing protein [Solirubrobacteraceae bacterium]
MKAYVPFKLALSALGAAAVLAATPAAAQAPVGPQVAGEGPGGRMPLGGWTMRLDSANRGQSLGWQRGQFSGKSVSVPNVIGASDYKGPRGAANYDGSVAWYRTTFQAPEAGTYAVAFASANFQATVWIDGHAAASHRGSYLPFEARARLAAGSHTMVVRIDWRDPEAQARSGFHRTWFNWGGLNGPVTVRAIGESELLAPRIATTLSPLSPHAESASVSVSVQVRNNAATRVLAPQGTLSREGESISIAFAPAEVQAGQTVTMTATVSVPHPALWSPARPALYQLELAIGQECSYAARVGLRQLSWHGGRLYFNGARVRLHGASLQEDALGHGDALTGSDEDTLVRELRQIHANAVRSQHPLDPGLLERLDAAGILVWQGVGPVEGAGNWYSNTPSLLRAAEQQARTAAQAAALHPSIFAWNLVDEVAGNGRNASEVGYVTSMTRWLHSTDPTRMVAVDVWGDHPPAHAGAMYSDVDAVAETDYTGWYDSPLASSSQQVAQMRSRLAVMQRTFAGKVLVISEFGAEANTLNPPGSAGSYAYQSALLARHIGVYSSDAQLTGMFIWDLRDYPLNPAFQGGSIQYRLPHLRLIEGLIQKGLFTYSGAAKLAVGVVAGLYAGLPGG